MAAYETQTNLSMTDAVARAREFFEMKQGLAVKQRFGPRMVWAGEVGDRIELRAFPIKGGGTRLELETLHSDELVLAFIKELPRPSLLSDLRKRFGG
jgi:hypothetical protein